MPRLWLINQFANTPDLPGHTRQYEVAAGLVGLGWGVGVFASDFNLTQRRYRRLHFPSLCSSERPGRLSRSNLLHLSFTDTRRTHLDPNPYLHVPRIDSR